MKSLYLSGSISENLDTAEARFMEAEAQARRAGYDVVYNPMRLGAQLKEALGREPTQEEYLSYELPFLLKSEAVLMLSGWKDVATAAKDEHHIAKLTGKLILEQKNLER
jgi:hypothetical protein